MKQNHIELMLTMRFKKCDSDHCNYFKQDCQGKETLQDTKKALSDRFVMTDIVQFKFILMV